MKILGKIMFFNKTFMTSFVTTIWKTVYFPSRENLVGRQNRASVTLAHEYVHATDAGGFFKFLLFAFLYLFPQSLAPFALLLIPVNWILALVVFAVLLAPIPAPWRRYYELRGYTMSLFVLNEMQKKAGVRAEDRKTSLYNSAERYNKQFTSANYYFMWPFGVEKKLKENADKIVSGRIMMEDEVYGDVLESLKDAGIV